MRHTICSLPADPIDKLEDVAMKEESTTYWLVDDQDDD